MTCPRCMGSHVTAIIGGCLQSWSAKVQQATEELGNSPFLGPSLQSRRCPLVLQKGKKLEMCHDSARMLPGHSTQCKQCDHLLVSVAEGIIPQLIKRDLHQLQHHNSQQKGGKSGEDHKKGLAPLRFRLCFMPHYTSGAKKNKKTENESPYLTASVRVPSMFVKAGHSNLVLNHRKQLSSIDTGVCIKR